MTDPIYLSPPHLSEESHQLVEEAMRSNWIAPVGPFLEKWEDEIFNLTGRYPVLTSSGEAALELGLRLLGVRSGDVVITASHTCNATVNAILHLGAKPVFVDSDAKHWNMSAIYLEEAVKTERKKGEHIAAILFVSIYGNSNGWIHIRNVANKYQIPILEDAAESTGSKVNNEFVGCLGDAGVWSFNGNKIITTSGGGVLLCKSQKEQAQALKWATQAKENTSWYEHKEVGHTYRMSNILAAIGLGQWHVLEERVRAKRHRYNLYTELWEELGLFSLVGSQEEGDAFSNRWLSAFLLDPQIGVTPSVIIQHLKLSNIEARHFWKPMHLQFVYRDFPYYGNDTSQALFENGICLPSGTGMTDEQWSRIKSSLKEILE